MLFFQAVQLRYKAVQPVMLELERVHQERGRNRWLEMVEMARYFRFLLKRVFILTVDKGKYGTSSGGYPRVVLGGLARLSCHVCAVFLLVLCPGSVLPQSRERLYRQWTRGRHGTSSGGCAAFWVNMNRVINSLLCGQFFCTSANLEDQME